MQLDSELVCWGSFLESELELGTFKNFRTRFSQEMPVLHQYSILGRVRPSMPASTSAQ